MDDAAPGPWSETWAFDVGVSVVDQGLPIDAHVTDIQVVDMRVIDAQIIDVQTTDIQPADMQTLDLPLDISVDAIPPQTDGTIPNSGSVSGDGCACEASGQEGFSWALFLLLLGGRRRRHG